MFIKRHDLAVENCLPGGNLFCHLVKLGILLRHLNLIARDKARLAATDETDRSKPVPLRLKDPFPIGKWIVDERCQHRLNLCSHKRGAGGGAESICLCVVGGLFYASLCSHADDPLASQCKLGLEFRVYRPGLKAELRTESTDVHASLRVINDNQQTIQAFETATDRRCRQDPA